MAKSGDSAIYSLHEVAAGIQRLPMLNACLWAQADLRDVLRRVPESGSRPVATTVFVSSAGFPVKNAKGSVPAPKSALACLTLMFVRPAGAPLLGMNLNGTTPTGELGDSVRVG